MAEVNGLVATQVLSHDEILTSTGDYPYKEVNMEGPSTANVADAVDFELGDLIKVDDVSGKLARYVDADDEDIVGICCEPYKGVELNAKGVDAGHVSLYIAGSIRKDKVFKSHADGSRLAVEWAEVIKSRKMMMLLS